MSKVKVFSLAALTLLASSVPLLAHHGTAVSYDQEHTVKVKGVVKEFLWRNPHSALFVDVKDASGNVVTYSIEMGSPNTLAGMGYRRASMKPGDAIELEMHPSFTNPSSGEAVSRGVMINGKVVAGGRNSDDN